jgi:hypothetical protein
MVFDMHERTIYVIEVASTGDSEGSLRNRYVKNSEIRTYCRGTPAGLQPLQKSKPKKNLVIGFMGSIKESRWRQSPSDGKMKSQQDKLIIWPTTLR